MKTKEELAREYAIEYEGKVDASLQKFGRKEWDYIIKVALEQAYLAGYSAAAKKLIELVEQEALITVWETDENTNTTTEIKVCDIQKLKELVGEE